MKNIKLWDWVYKIKDLKKLKKNEKVKNKNTKIIEYFVLVKKLSFSR